MAEKGCIEFRFCGGRSGWSSFFRYIEEHFDEELIWSVFHYAHICYDLVLGFLRTWYRQGLCGYPIFRLEISLLCIPNANVMIVKRRCNIFNFSSSLFLGLRYRSFRRREGSNCISGRCLHVWGRVSRAGRWYYFPFRVRWGWWELRKFRKRNGLALFLCTTFYGFYSFHIHHRHIQRYYISWFDGSGNHICHTLLCSRMEWTFCESWGKNFY